jgi:fructokinase
MAAPRFVVVGEALVDIVVSSSGGEPEPAPGGSPLNVAVGLARLGVDTLLMTEVGDDAHGRLLLDHVAASGVPLDEASVVPGLRTSSATAHLDEHGAASYTFDLRWTLGPRALPAGTTALHVGSLGAALRPGRDSVVDLVAQATDEGLLVTFDPNARPSLTPDAGRAWDDAREVAAGADLVKLSDEDLEFLQPGSTPADLAARLLGGRTRLVVVTAGGSGAFAASADGSVELHSRPVDVVDTVGAGDSFMAALLAIAVEHGLDDLDERRLEAYVHAAHQAAAVTVSRRGADPPWRSELPADWPALPPS